MTKIKSLLLAAGCAAFLVSGSNSVFAQGGGRGNFDPAQMRERMVERYKESMDVTDDAEWKVLQDAIGKVIDARFEVMQGQFGGGRGGRRNNNNNGDNNNADNNGGQQRRRGGFGTPSPEAEALQKAIDDKAPADEIKAKLSALRQSNAAKDAKLTAAQDDLKKLLTARQEAVAVLGGLLK
ncbi:MAG TPA: hypothetical protein VH413_01445 [Verrucomicrobiae bacterium]|jgi:hypothetical protein|nr:hypothetical protein [Verrucomicrobiae bacterium]